ncbi:epidermal retinol dehydrogenase 2-like [Nylanderia fulva]|uniref:epidermal retinol dehydrogenase 2-like n=1 Tax=Nylanderia fulva TaxID=613905 RepID=UPI0010FB30C9|nr:epidermal retinol dehydrogenase 2-like [Nylanderia fulva]
MATTEDNVTKIHDLVLADRRLKVREIAETVGISKDRVGHILHEILGMRKLSARWVPRLLTPDNKRNRRRHGQIGRIALQTAAPSTVFSRFGPVRLFLFPNLKKSLAGQKFESNEEVIAATEAYFADLEKTYFLDELKKLEHCWVKVSILVNNAGYVYGRTFMELPDCEIEQTFKVNILSHYWITKSFLKDMMKNNHGHIVTIASVTGLIGTYKCTDYSATKFAAIGCHESLFTELKVNGYDGIHMTLVCPYLINTGMFNGVNPRLMPMLEPEYVAERVITGVLANEMLIVLPNIIKYVLLFKCLFPIKMCWALMYHVLKGPQIMMTFKGRESRKTSIDSDSDSITSITNYKHICK